VAALPDESGSPGAANLGAAHLDLAPELRRDAQSQSADQRLSDQPGECAPRPKLVHYVEASSVLQRHLHDLVLGTVAPSKAMADAQTDLVRCRPASPADRAYDGLRW